MLIRLALLLAVTFSANSYAANVTIHKNEVSGLLTWSSEDKGFSIELIQLLPDFIRAIYASHDFPKIEIESIAAFCVFGTVIKNTSQQQLEYSVSDWYYVTKDRNEQHLKTKSKWIEQWQKAGVTFSWTLLPDKGVFEVGDWQQGFTTIKLPRNAVFDLVYKWKLDGTKHSGKLESLRCAPENVSIQ